MKSFGVSSLLKVISNKIISTIKTSSQLKQILRNNNSSSFGTTRCSNIIDTNNKVIEGFIGFGIFYCYGMQESRNGLIVNKLTILFKFIMNNRIFRFQNTNILAQALTNKIHELEYQSKKGTKYPFGNNEEFIVIGQMILEFYFSDYLMQRGYPKKDSSIKKPSDLVLLRQRLLNDKNLAEIAIQYNVHNFVQIGNQTALKKNSKVLAETLKAMVAAQYYDSGFDLEHTREILQSILKELLDKGQNVPIAELKQNPKTSFLEYINNQTDLIPKVSVEWKKDENSINVYKIQLELDSYINITKTGANKRQTEQLVYQEALKQIKYKLANQNQMLKKTKKNNPLNKALQYTNQITLLKMRANIFNFQNIMNLVNQIQTNHWVTRQSICSKNQHFEKQYLQTNTQNLIFQFIQEFSIQFHNLI
ncbi:unnamed protein product (macronuclear) [Paramecium tetraurelia]|uniref:RNase III domain-containing protein n=1 Tax=Paramecium tetraurelia TaxID=5888 RepID=A0DAM6_PARTE|nr:uncharacterized protein GSPATT00015000001 [Paramecium tetraurelia]CAK80093.1 unnamed protein product [Paramecium tetraurelia]|eukprot:XP_001447490.1 hypothetical protein (macronuclear) [Paramecium tetraurelia strain d4-2]